MKSRSRKAKAEAESRSRVEAGANTEAGANKRIRNAGADRHIEKCGKQARSAIAPGKRGRDAGWMRGRGVRARTRWWQSGSRACRQQQC